MCTTLLVYKNTWFDSAGWVYNNLRAQKLLRVDYACVFFIFLMWCHLFIYNYVDFEIILVAILVILTSDVTYYSNCQRENRTPPPPHFILWNVVTSLGENKVI